MGFNRIQLGPIVEVEDRAISDPAFREISEGEAIAILSRRTLGNKMRSSQTDGPTDQKSTFSCTEIMQTAQFRF